MSSFYFAVSGKPSTIQKVYQKLNEFLFGLDYVSDGYEKTVFLPRGTSEIEVLDKRGRIVSYYKSDFSIRYEFSTKFIRNEGRTIGQNSKLVLKLNSEDPFKLVNFSSKISQLDPSFNLKENYSFELEDAEDLDLI